ncbi:flavonol sulfotransferase-like [Nicotiana tabacum]|uniref:Sulfotransferase n=2 Tax=Nicotiana TaxID=4085 RepID=A0A1S4A6V1_TOBAC|nr:PREDICTED: flavonol sulfotransferase-like [Nicotiana sylvestris]XP_016472349.1 PREDICTED: flavonol sulfotransferase-like isoform X2 [Nicotiana tabacum]XP_016472350.1 PREDICTED: flavonol sulfotransferase-like isoform X2 [Nicotiana tabacum]
MSLSGCSQHELDDEYKKADKNDSDMLTTLPKEKGWITEHLYQYQSFWFTPEAIKGIKRVQECFKAQPTDAILVTFPKSGTTWFKALIFSLMNRDRFDFSSHPLLTKGPHDCIPFLEAIIRNETSYQDYRISCSPCCLFATHIPYSLLPASVMSSGCKIVYVFREPKDVLVSNWLFMTKVRLKELPSFSIKDAFDLFCKGMSHYGPYWDQVLGYWKASMENPDKVLLLTYEDMKKDPILCLSKLAKFLDKPFCLEEEREGVVQEIVRLCSFENLSSLAVKQNGVQHLSPQFTVANRDFLRKGQVGDWKNHLTPEMAEQLDEITRQKLGGTSLIGTLFGDTIPYSAKA